MVAHTQTASDIDKLKMIINLSKGYFEMHPNESSISSDDWMHVHDEDKIANLLDEKSGLPTGNVILLELETTTANDIIQAMKCYFRQLLFFEQNDLHVKRLITALKETKTKDAKQRPQLYQQAMRSLIKDLLDEKDYTRAYCLHELLHFIHATLTVDELENPIMAPNVTASIAPMFQEAFHLSNDRDCIALFFEAFASIVKDENYAKTFHQCFPEIDKEEHLSSIRPPENEPSSIDAQVPGAQAPEVQAPEEKILETHKPTEPVEEALIEEVLIEQMPLEEATPTAKEPEISLEQELEPPPTPQVEQGSPEMLESNEPQKSEKLKVSVTPVMEEPTGPMVSQTQTENAQAIQEQAASSVPQAQASDSHVELSVSDSAVLTPDEACDQVEEIHLELPRTEKDTSSEVDEKAMLAKAAKKQSTQIKLPKDKLEFYWGMGVMKAKAFWAYAKPRMIHFWNFAYPKCKAFAIWLWPKLLWICKKTWQLICAICKKTYTLIQNRNKK